MPTSARKAFVDMAGGDSAHILVIPSASENPEAPGFLDYWTAAKTAEILHAKSRDEALSPEFYLRIRNATGIWISGGDQKRLMVLYGGTPVIDELKMLLKRGGVIGGTSAGASIVGHIMPYEDTEMVGFGLIDNYIVDQHFNTRSWRIDRLKRLVQDHPHMVGVGIDESTAFVINNNSFDVIGEGGVHYVR